ALAAGVAATLRSAPELGVMTHFAQGWKLDAVPRLAQAGLTQVRDELYWEEIEPERGRYVFPPLYENYMTALREQKITPLIALTFANKNYDGGLTPHTEEGLDGYARYAVEVLRHYGSQIKALEIWNEYNGTFCKGPATQDRPGTYVRMLKKAYSEIKRVRPDVVVVGGSTAGLPLPYLERLFALGALDSMDAVSIHPYRSDTEPEGLETRIAALRDLIARYNHGKPKPIWVTEIGWGTRQARAVGDLAIDERTQAMFLVRTYALLVTAGVERIYWYLFRDYDQFATMGLVRGDAALTPKPAYRAMTTLQAYLRDAEFVERDKTTDGVYSLRFRRKSGGEFRIMWSWSPVTLPATGVDRVVDMLGAERPVLPTLTLTDSPLYVEGAVNGLPKAGAALLAPLVTEAFTGFSAEQGRNGWSYGVFAGESTQFVPLPTSRVTNWKEEWTGIYPHISITASDQHPSASGPKPMSAVRRWESYFSGTALVSGRFKSSTQGDGVRARILLDGKTIWTRALGGGQPILGEFSLEVPVEPGSCVDFAVDPGPGAKINFDSTQVSIAIRRK
ncbi:MAG TPA: glycosyl hydrolase, partial [Opitutaceae bacterium]